MGASWSVRSGKSRFSAGDPVSYLSLYLLDFYFTVSIFILHNLLLLDSISFLLYSKSTFIIRRSRAKHFGSRHFLTTKAPQNPLQPHKILSSFIYGVLPAYLNGVRYRSTGTLQRCPVLQVRTQNYTMVIIDIKEM